MTDQESVLWAVQAIRQYLQQRPAAADTLEGIHHQWMDWPPDAVMSPQLTHQALLQLEALGELMQQRRGRMLIWRRSQPS